MPRENKKRGRWPKNQAQSAPVEDDDDEHVQDHKRRRTSALEPAPEAQQDLPFFEDTTGEFFGVLDETEQAIFHTVAQDLDRDDFPDQEEKNVFLDNVWKDIDGKETKLACSQSASRLFERLIRIASPAHLIPVLRAFKTHFLTLIQHRFASHTCQTLSKRIAFLLSQTNTTYPSTDLDQLESSFTSLIHELDSSWGFLLTSRFASHVIRSLVQVLSGDKAAIEDVGTSKATKVSDLSPDNHASHLQKIRVPAAFNTLLEHVLARCVQVLDSGGLKALATHPQGGPTLQLLLAAELDHFGRASKGDVVTVLDKLFPLGDSAEVEETSKYISSLMYDAVGSRLVETVIQSAPGRTFKKLYKEVFKDRMGSLARNDVAGYTVCKALERIGKEELEEALQKILPQVPGLADRGRTTVLKTLIERCAARNVDTTTLAETLASAFASRSTDQFSVCSLLGVPEEILEVHQDQALAGLPTLTVRPPTQDGNSSNSAAAQVHRSVLAQTMLDTPGPVSELVFAALSDLPVPACLSFAKTPHLSRVLQTALLSRQANLIFRRKLITRFYGHFAMLSLDNAGSHLVDAIWQGTHGMAFLRERVAEELAEAEQNMRNSNYGRAVWRNWRMDLYKSRRREWVRQVKDEVGNNGFVSFPDNAEPSEPSAVDELSPNKTTSNGHRFQAHTVKKSIPKKAVLSQQQGRLTPRTNGKSGLQLAREKFAKAKLHPPIASGSNGQILGD